MPHRRRAVVSSEDWDRSSLEQQFRLYEDVHPRGAAGLRRWLKVDYFRRIGASVLFPETSPGPLPGGGRPAKATMRPRLATARH